MTIGNTQQTKHHEFLKVVEQWWTEPQGKEKEQ